MSGPDWLKGTVFAHRGWFSPDDPGCPENSMPAMERAVAAGFGIELDVRPSSDGVAMVFHDAELDRLTDHRGTFSALPREKLTRIHVRQGGTIPRLTDVLDMVGGRVPVLIEMKASDRRARLEESVRWALEGYRGPAAVMSFSRQQVSWFHSYARHIPRGLVASCQRDDELRVRSGVGLRWALSRARAQFLAFDVRCLPNKTCKRLKQDGFPVLCWTVRSPTDVIMARTDAHSLICEDPALSDLHNRQGGA